MIYFTIYVKQTSIICSCTYILPKIRGIVSAIIGVVIIIIISSIITIIIIIIILLLLLLY